MEAEIRNTKAELKELRAMHDDAHISKEAAQQELAKHEKVVYTERKQREVELQKMKKEAEEKKMQHERIERRIVGFCIFVLFTCPHNVWIFFLKRGKYELCIFDQCTVIHTFYPWIHCLLFIRLSVAPFSRMSSPLRKNKLCKGRNNSRKLQHMRRHSSGSRKPLVCRTLW